MPELTHLPNDPHSDPHWLSVINDLGALEAYPSRFSLLIT